LPDVPVLRKYFSSIRSNICLIIRLFSWNIIEINVKTSYSTWSKTDAASSIYVIATARGVLHILPIILSLLRHRASHRTWASTWSSTRASTWSKTDAASIYVTCPPFFLLSLLRHRASRRPRASHNTRAKTDSTAIFFFLHVLPIFSSFYTSQPLIPPFSSLSLYYVISL
jgi:hypothetical protein